MAMSQSGALAGAGAGDSSDDGSTGIPPDAGSNAALTTPVGPAGSLRQETPPALRRLIDRVAAARADGTPLRLVGGGTKDWYGEVPRGEPLMLRELAGISSYEPTELVVTARCGTPLAELEAVLAERGQCLPFEPPRFGAAGVSTIGGMVAAGMAGPSRAAVGSVRDHVLGATLLNGAGEVMSFGGQVMKNVAGYDVSRLLAGSLGVLGPILEVSLKVMPIVPDTVTLRLELDAAGALAKLNAWAGQPLPLNASAWHDGRLSVRLTGAAAAVAAARARIGGEALPADAAAAFWLGLRDQTDAFFGAGSETVTETGEARHTVDTLWRLSLPSTARPLALAGTCLIEWGGAQRWLRGADAPVAAIRQAAADAGGHATLYRTADRSAGVFAPLAPPLERIHRALKQAFDPAGLFNPGRLYPGL